eukprot:6305927-Amphidinium_carterae.1
MLCTIAPEFCVMQGGDEVDLAFAAVAPASIDITAINKDFASWVGMVAEGKAYRHCGLTPSAAGLMKTRVMGSSMVCSVQASKYVQYLHSQRKDASKKVTVSEATTAFMNLQAEIFKNQDGRLQDLPFIIEYVTLNPYDLLWIPVGHIVAEMMLDEGPFWYGIRKSYYAKDDPAAIANMRAIVTMMEAEGNASNGAQTLNAIIAAYEKEK